MILEQSTVIKYRNKLFFVVDVGIKYFVGLNLNTGWNENIIIPKKPNIVNGKKYNFLLVDKKETYFAFIFVRDFDNQEYILGLTKEKYPVILAKKKELLEKGWKLYKTKTEEVN